MLTKGIDISHYDPNCDWNKIKADGVDFVYIKCTQGLHFSDPLCLGHATKAKSVGIKVGYYHFAEITDDAVQEAKFFLGKLATLPQSDLLPVLDIETNKIGLDATHVEAWIHSFLDTIKQYGKTTMIYSYTPFLDQYLPHTHQFGIVPLWIAQYRNISSPLLPHGWNTAALWQYTNQGHVNGISVPVDMNKPITQSFVI